MEKNRSMGPKNDDLTMEEPKTINKIERVVKDFHGIFVLEYGPLSLYGHQDEKTFLLEIDYTEAENTHTQLLGDSISPGQLCCDYAEEAEKLAKTFCENNGFVVDDIITSWPEFQAILTRK